MAPLDLLQISLPTVCNKRNHQIDIPSLDTVHIGGMNTTQDNILFEHFVTNEKPVELMSGITSIVIPSNSYNEMNVTRYSLKGMSHLELVDIGNDCFFNVEEVSFEGLPALKNITIGLNSFTSHRSGYAYDPLRSLHISNCSSLLSISIDRFSFSDYSSFTVTSIYIVILSNRSSIIVFINIWRFATGFL